MAYRAIVELCSRLRSVPLGGTAGVVGGNVSVLSVQNAAALPSGFVPAAATPAVVNTAIAVPATGVTAPATASTINDGAADGYATLLQPEVPATGAVAYAAHRTMAVQPVTAMAAESFVIGTAGYPSAYAGIFNPAANHGFAAAGWTGAEYGLTPAALAAAGTGGAAGARSGADSATGKRRKSRKRGASGSGGPAPGKKAGKSQMISYIRQVARKFKLNERMLVAIAKKESNFKAGVANNWDSNARKGTPSKGLFQFIKPTFDSFARHARKADPELWADLGPLNWMDWRQQTLAAAWAIKNGKGGHWATFGAAKAAARS